MERREIKDDLFIRLCFEIMKRGEEIGTFADKEGNITLVKDRLGDLFWILKGRVGEAYDGGLDFRKTDDFMIGQHAETLKCVCLSRMNIKELKGKTTIDEFAAELKDLYEEFGNGELKEEERKRDRGILLSYYREIKEAEKGLGKQDGEDIFGYAARLAKQPESYLIRQYSDILTKSIETLKEIAVMEVLTDNKSEKKLYGRTIDRIVSETLSRIN